MVILLYSSWMVMASHLCLQSLVSVDFYCFFKGLFFIRLSSKINVYLRKDLTFNRKHYQSKLCRSLTEARERDSKRRVRGERQNERGGDSEKST